MIDHYVSILEQLFKTYQQKLKKKKIYHYGTIFYYCLNVKKTLNFDDHTLVKYSRFMKILSFYRICFVCH